MRVRFLGTVVLGICIGCNQQSAQNFQTYDQLLNQERATDKPGTDAAEGSDLVLGATTSAAPEPDANTSDATSGDEFAEIPASALAPMNVVDGTSASAILKVVDRTAVPAAPISAATVVPAETDVVAPSPRSVELLIPEKSFRIEGPSSARRVSYDDLDLLKVLNMEPVPADATRYFPKWLAGLDGQTIRIRGFMYPTFESSGIEQFVLARDNQICCFGRDPKVYDLIAVSLKTGAATDYIPNRPFDVVGTLRIDLLADGGKPMGLYWLDEAQVLDR